MADAMIDVIDSDELPLVVELHNQIFRPAQGVDSFGRRYQGRHNVLQLVARVKEQPAGFFLGYEQDPEAFFGWFCGVVSEFRRTGIGSQLMQAAQSWAAENGYERFTLECRNSHRPMMHLALELGYDVVGTRRDTDNGGDVVLFEKPLTGH